MATTPLRYHGTALVTGASAGLGEHFAEFLARNGMNLIVTARRAEALDELATRLRDRYGVQVTVLPADLADRDDRQRLIAEILASGVTVTGLVNNAGFGYIGDFADQPTDNALDLIEVNVAALTHLTRAFLSGMLANGDAFIINVSSTAAYQPIPSWAVYAAAKAYVLHFTEALWDELRDTSVRVIAISPGPTKTAFFVNAGDPGAMRPRRRTPEQVVQTTFRALQRHKPSVIDGVFNAVQAIAARMAPRRLALPIAEKAVE